MPTKLRMKNRMWFCQCNFVWDASDKRSRMEIEHRRWMMDQRDRLVQRRRPRRWRVQNWPRVVVAIIVRPSLALCCASSTIYASKKERLSRTSAETRERTWHLKERKETRLSSSFFSTLLLILPRSVEIKRRWGSSTRGMPAGWRPRYHEKNWTTSSTRYAVRSLDRRCAARGGTSIRRAIASSSTRPATFAIARLVLSRHRRSKTRGRLVCQHFVGTSSVFNFNDAGITNASWRGSRGNGEERVPASLLNIINVSYLTLVRISFDFLY